LRDIVAAIAIASRRLFLCEAAYDADLVLYITGKRSMIDEYSRVTSFPLFLRGLGAARMVGEILMTYSEAGSLVKFIADRARYRQYADIPPSFMNVKRHS
jgi:hypothetical protein